MKNKTASIVFVAIMLLLLTTTAEAFQSRLSPERLIEVTTPTADLYITQGETKQRVSTAQQGVRLWALKTLSGSYQVYDPTSKQECLIQQDQVKVITLSAVAKWKLSELARVSSHKEGDVEAGIRLWKSSIETATNDIGKHPIISTLYMHLFNLYIKQGNTQAAEEALQTVIELNQIKGPSDPAFAVTKLNYASFLDDQGRTDEADKIYVDVFQVLAPRLESPDESLGHEKKALLLQVVNASIWATIWREQSHVTKENLAALERIVGIQPIRTYLTTHGCALYRAGKYKEAIEACQKSIVLIAGETGLPDPNPIDLALVAMSYHQLGAPEKATEFMNKALLASLHPNWLTNPKVLIFEGEMTRLISNVDPLGIEKSRQSTAGVTTSPEESRITQAIELRERIVGDESEPLLRRLTDLGEYYTQKQHNFPAAEILYTRALEMSEKIYGAEAPKTAGHLSILGVTRSAQGKYAKAESLFQKALSIEEKHFGAGSYETSDTLSNLAACYKSQQKFSEAKRAAVASLQRMEKKLGAGHPKTLYPLRTLGGVFLLQGKYSDAQTFLEKTLEIAKQVHGDTHMFTEQARHELAHVHKQQGNFATAKVHLQDALASATKLHGAADPRTKAIQNALDQLAEEINKQ